MSMAEAEALVQAKRALEKILQNVPKLTVKWAENTTGTPGTGAQADLALEITHDNRVYIVAIEFKAHGFPKQLQQAIGQLLRYQHKHNRHDELMVAAPFITPEGAKVCQDDNVSYFDLAGNCRIAMGLLYIERTGIPNPFQKNVMAAPSLFGMRGERILRTLLNGPKKAWKVAPLAQATGTSLGTVSTIRRLLMERDWAKDTSDGILLTQPEKLLKNWADVWGRRALRPFPYFSRVGTLETEAKMAAFAKKEGRKFALTGAAGAWRIAPMTRYERTQVYWDGEPEQLAQALEFKKTESGANVHILLPRDRGVFDFAEEIEGIPVVCPVQLYLDLQRDPNRGYESATHLWHERIFRG